MDSDHADDLANESLQQIKEIEALMREEDGKDETFSSYLRSQDDLSALIKKQDAELKSLCISFIDNHVKQADSIVQLYMELTDADRKIESFEEEIVNFLRNLEESANDIVVMQQNTETLVRSVSQRRQVSGKIHEVYTALQECDTFCEDIANKEVDRAYLTSLREIDQKLSFLSKNKSLQGSAVDNELRPKLEVAARKAGDKLQRYLAKRLETLSACSTLAEIETEQESLEQSAQYAYRFLLLYNTPVAQQISKLYQKLMTPVYVQHIRAALRELTEAANVHAQPLGPLLSSEQLTDILSNRDCGAPKGNQVQPTNFNYPGKILSARDRSVSQHIRGGESLGGASTGMEGTNIRSLKEATFEEDTKPLREIRVRYGKLYFNEKTMRPLNDCNSWTWRFARFVKMIVNICASECRFIGNFFCLAVDIEQGGDINVSEKLARSILGASIQEAENVVMRDISMVSSRSAVLASLRFLEVAKQYLCTSLDPIPLVLLSGLLEMTKAGLKQSLFAAMSNDTAVFSVLDNLRTSPFQSAPSEKTSSSQLVTSGKGYLLTLGPHSVLCNTFEVIGQLEYLNSAPFRCETFSGGATSTFDVKVFNFVSKSVGELIKFTDLIARRHKSVVAQSLFSAINVCFILFSWRQITVKNPIPDFLIDKTITPNAIISSEGTLNLIQTEYKKHFLRFFKKDSESSPDESFFYLFSFMETVEKTVGDAFFNSTDKDAMVAEQTKLSQLNISEDQVRVVVERFQQKWMSELEASLDRSKTLFRAVFEQVKGSYGGKGFVELETTFSNDYLQLFVEFLLAQNTKFSTLVNAYFKNHKTSLVSNVSLLQQIKQLQ